MITYNLRKPVKTSARNSVGVTGENNAYTAKFLIKKLVDRELSFSIHLRFADGSVNNVVPDEVSFDDKGATIIWNVKNTDIFVHGFFELQIEGRKSNGYVFQTEIIRMYADESICIEDQKYNNPNSETLKLRKEAYELLCELKLQQDNLDDNMRQILATDITNKVDKATVIAELEGNLTFALHSNFVRANVRSADGLIDTNVKYRVTSEDIMKFDYDLNISVDSGFTAYVVKYSNGSYILFKLLSDSNGWTIPAETEFRIHIRRNYENTSETADINEFVNAVKFQTKSIYMLKGKQNAQYITNTIKSVDELISLNDVNTVYNGVISGFSKKFGQTSDSVYVGFRMWFELESPKEARSYARIISLSDGTMWTYFNSEFHQMSYSKKQIDKLISDITVSGGGIAGADGKSAYEIAVENGFSGTEAQWLASLKGSDGTNGSNGIGIEYADINNNGDLILFYSDGTQENLGVVVGADGTNGKDGKDYVLTSADKQEIANLSADTIPEYIRTAAETVANKVLSVTGEANAEGSSAGYTNQLLRATDESGNLYNNGKGYKTDCRLNSSGIEKNDYTGVCCTGFISCKAGDIIRFKNVTVASSTVTAYIAKYDTDKAFVSVSSAANDIIENSYTVAGSSTAYVRFSLGQITDNSIITVNEEISKIVAGETTKAVVPFNLAFITDLHYDDAQIGRYTAAKKAMDVINETASIDVEIMGGDYCNNYTASTGGTAIEAREDISNCKKMFSDSRRRLWLRGNHDSNGYPNERLPKAEIYNRIFRSQHTMDGFVENPADPYGCYGYMDFDNAKIRLIVVNTSDNDSFGTATPEQSTHTAPMINSHNIGAKQLQWIADTALNFSGKDDVTDWGVIFVSHVPIYNTNSWYNSHTYVDDNEKSWDCNLINLANLAVNYKNKTHFRCINNGETVNRNFTELTEQAKILCFISGHTHALTNTSYYGLNFISCPNSNGGANVSTNGISYAKSNVGNVGETALSVISVDRANKKIHAFCYGAGTDREIYLN